MKIRLMVVLFAVALTISAITIMLEPQNSLAARWYGGNNQTAAYGVKADISTPSSAPYLGDEQGEVSWVSTPNYSDAWIQTGWHYWAYNSSARPYVELGPGGGSNMYFYGTQPWGESKNYKVVYDSYFDSWDAYIGGVFRVGLGGSAVPDGNITLLAWAEVHNSSNTVLNTDFNSVMWKDSSGTWYSFNQSTLFAYSPYHYQGSYYHYIIYGPD